MLNAGRQRRDLGKVADRLTCWQRRGPAFENACADFVTIAFASNVTDRDAARRAHRILKPGGRFLCLEFSQVDSRSGAPRRRLSFNVLPRLGQVVAGDAESYRFSESIRTFPAPEVLADMFAGAGFAQVRGAAAIGRHCLHSFGMEATDAGIRLGDFPGNARCR